jgi:very-short-patch-repair endonuclease
MQHMNALTVVPVQIPPSLVVWFGILIVFALALQIVFRLLEPRKRANGLYERKPYLLSEGENAFLPALEQAVGNQYRIAMKVNLCDLVRARGNGSDAAAARNRICQKHVDFVLCSHYPVKPVLVIELDDSSHDRPDRQQRDAIVDDCLASAGLPILHVRCRQAYDVRQLAAEIRAKVG